MAFNLLRKMHTESIFPLSFKGRYLNWFFWGGLDSTAFSGHPEILLNCMWPGAGIAPVLLRGCSLGRKGTRGAAFDLVACGGQRRFLEVRDLGCSFSSISTQNKGWQWERHWLMTRYDFASLSVDCPSAKCCFTWLPREDH